MSSSKFLSHRLMYTDFGSNTKGSVRYCSLQIPNWVPTSANKLWHILKIFLRFPKLHGPIILCTTSLVNVPTSYVNMLALAVAVSHSPARQTMSRPTVSYHMESCAEKSANLTVHLLGKRLLCTVTNYSKRVVTLSAIFGGSKLFPKLT
jgi:hypothetical protein